MPKEHLLTAARKSSFCTSLGGTSSPVTLGERLEVQVTWHMWAHPALLAVLAARDPRCDSSTWVTNMCCPPRAAPGEIQCFSLSHPPASPHFQSSAKTVYFTLESSLFYPFFFLKEETDSTHTPATATKYLYCRSPTTCFAGWSLHQNPYPITWYSSKPRTGSEWPPHRWVLSIEVTGEISEIYVQIKDKMGNLLCRDLNSGFYRFIAVYFY